MDKKRSILIIEDRENTRTVLKDILEAKGYQVEGAASGEEGLRILGKKIMDMAIVDTLMPGGMDGFEVCRQIKQVRRLPVKVIVYTGTMDAIDAVKARKMGADDYVVKGSDPTDLIQAVVKLI